MNHISGEVKLLTYTSHGSIKISDTFSVSDCTDQETEGHGFQLTCCNSPSEGRAGIQVNVCLIHTVDSMNIGYHEHSI